MRKAPGSPGPFVLRLVRRCPLSVGVRHEYVGDMVLALVGPDPDAVSMELISHVLEAGAGVVMMDDSQRVSVGHVGLTGP
ncbi:hypothetical protein GCM10010172_54930 [Paractinoplanes ferrugineus]|uniref:Uncharacterized protein n=1 Tax=Paractinoplanes ferrugineus TaxID=113564 RepID=A0A919J0A3_9ACTN|nr:hypothetical protein Afe05nite_35300 [Actinoplanes ferrugineus]